MKFSSFSLNPYFILILFGKIKYGRTYRPKFASAALPQHKEQELAHSSRQCKHMITVLIKKSNTFSQNFYDSIVNNINFCSVTCTCGHTGCLTKHGYYKRSFRFKSHNYTIFILRMKCSQCGHTHAILLSIMVPYSQIPLEDQISIIDAYESGGNIMSVVDENCLIEPQEVYKIIQKYTKLWKQRLLSEALKLTESITRDCFAAFSMQFMQIRRRLGKLIF